MGCRTTDFLLSRTLRSPDTPPFIGLVSMRDDQRRSALKNLENICEEIQEEFQVYFISSPMYPLGV